MTEKKGEEPSHKGDICKLYRRVAGLYGLETSGMKKNFDMVYGGLFSIVGGIANARNEFSDAHGGDENRVKPDERQARLVLNAAMTVAEYLLSL